MGRIFLSRLTKSLSVTAVTGALLFGASQCDAQLIHKKKKVNKSTSSDNNAQPDKLLYDKAMDDIQHGRHETGRLNMQTLINTYPDSEYLAKAKLAIADSYFKEGGTANMTQAIAAYKDFGVFFPFLQEASYAQLQVAICHYRQIEKPDRDRSEAHQAEEEFQTFLQKYPNDPLAPRAEQQLREVQEVLAEGDYRIGYYYYVKGDKRAAASRLMSLTTRYPLYSKSDRALWMLGTIWESTEKKDFAANYYSQIVRNYPLSPLVPDAKARLTAMKVPVPQADPKAMAWMTADSNTPRPHESLVKKPLAMLRSGPDAAFAKAARSGAPNLEPDSDTSGFDILAGGNHSTIGGSGTGIVATVTPGSSAPSTGSAENTGTAIPASEGSGTATTPNAAAPNAAPNTSGTNQADPPTPPPTTAPTTPVTAPGNNNGAATAATGATPPANANSDANSAANSSSSTVKPDSANTTAPTQDSNSDAAKSDTAKSADGQAQDASQSNNASSDDANKGKESSSKKKKKFFPW